MSEPSPVRAPVSLSVLANLLTNRMGALQAGLLHDGAIVSDLPNGWLVKATFEIGKQAMPAVATLLAEHESGVSVLANIESLSRRVWAVNTGLGDIPPIARYVLTRAFVVYVVEDQHDQDERFFVLPYDLMRQTGKLPAPEALYRSGRALDWKGEGVLTADTLVPDEPVGLAPSLALEPKWWIGRTEADEYEVFSRMAASIDELKATDPTLAGKYYRGLAGPFASKAEAEADIQTRLRLQAPLNAEVHGRIPGGRPFGQSISKRPTRVAVELMGNPDNGGTDDAATIDVIALLMREGYEYSAVMNALEALDESTPLPEGEDHGTADIRRQLDENGVLRGLTSLWPKDAPPPPVPTCG